MEQNKFRKQLVEEENEKENRYGLGVDIFKVISVFMVAVILMLVVIGVLALYYPETRNFIFNILKEGCNEHITGNSMFDWLHG